MNWFKICTDYYNAGYYNNTTLKVFVVKGKITSDQYKIITRVDYLLTPLAPAVVADNVNNLIVDIDNTMETALDGITDYTVYNKDTLLNLSGEHTVKVRVSALANISNASVDTLLTFTTNPVTPDAPIVTNDDTTNTVMGMALGMEYKLDSADYVAYDEAIFNLLDFSGEHTLLVRVAAQGINPASLETTLIFITNL